MSHTSSISAIKITSLSALRAAAEELSRTGVACSLVENDTPRAFYKDQAGMGRADLVLKLNACPYDVGLYKQADGSYEVRTDFWDGHVEKLLGGPTSDPSKREQAKLGKLFQMYGIHAATETARRKGLSVRRIAGENGQIKLELTGASL